MPPESNLSEADLKKMEKQQAAADKKAQEEEAAAKLIVAEPKPCEHCLEKEALIEALKAAQTESVKGQTIEPVSQFGHLEVNRSSVVRIP